MTSWCALVLVLVAAPVYRCPGVDGTPLFTDRPCSGGVEQAIEPLSVVAPAALTEAERAALEAIDAARGNDARESRARPSAGAREREAACDAARATLASVREARRRGYLLKDGAALDARERSARAAAETSCGVP
jgi:hypothetical protein